MPWRLFQTYHVWWAGPKAVGVTLPSRKGPGPDNRPHEGTHQDDPSPAPSRLRDCRDSPAPCHPEGPRAPGLLSKIKQMSRTRSARPMFNPSLAGDGATTRGGEGAHGRPLRAPAPQPSL